MWPWPPWKRDDESFRGRLRRVEEDCMRRLTFVEQHVQRMERQGPWQVQMTVVDADIMPLDKHVAVYQRLATLLPWQWVVITVVALLLGFGIGLMF